MFRVFLTLVVALGVSSFALAEEKCKKGDGAKAAQKGHGGHAKSMDTNGDGKISKEEFVAAVTKRAKDPEKAKAAAEKKFSAIDKDGDGSITPEELKAAAAKHEGGKKGEGKKGEGKKAK